MTGALPRTQNPSPLQRFVFMSAPPKLLLERLLGTKLQLQTLHVEEVKVKFALEEAVKAQTVTRGIALLFL